MSLYGNNNGPLPLLPFHFLCCGGRGNAWLAYGPGSCGDDNVSEAIAPGDTWTTPSRGRCMVTTVHAWLTLPDGSQLECTHYHSASGTSYPTFYVTMGGGDGCCVRSSSQSGECGPEQTYVHNPNYNYDGTPEKNETIDGWFQG